MRKSRCRNRNWDGGKKQEQNDDQDKWQPARHRFAQGAAVIALGSGFGAHEQLANKLRHSPSTTS